MSNKDTLTEDDFLYGIILFARSRELVCDTVLESIVTERACRFFDKYYEGCRCAILKWLDMDEDTELSFFATYKISDCLEKALYEI